MRFLALVLVVISLAGCVYDAPSASLIIHNDSNSTIYIHATCLDSLAVSELRFYWRLLPSSNAEKQNLDSIPPITYRADERHPKDSVASSEYRIKPYQATAISVGGTRKRPQIPCKDQNYINLFFLSESIMKTHSVKDICEKQLYQNKIQLTKQQLDSMNWEIKYVPSNNLKK